MSSLSAYAPITARSGTTGQGLGMDVIAEHLSHLAFRGYRPRTIEAKRFALRRAQRAVGPLLEATGDDLYAWVAGMSIGPDASGVLISTLRIFYRWAVIAGHLDADPSARLERPARKRRLPRPMPQRDVDRAMQLAPEPIRSWVHLAALSGLRCCEIAPLRAEDRSGDLLVIREQKGGDEGVVVIGPRLDLALAHLPSSGWWFPRWDGQGGPISAGQLQRHANRFLHEIGIEHTMHTLRHRYLTDFYRVSRDLRATQEAGRHRSIASTVGYTALDPESVRSVVEMIG